MTSGERRRPGAGIAAGAAASLALLLAVPFCLACGSGHAEEVASFSAPAGPIPAPFDAILTFGAGQVRLTAVSPGKLYEARISHCGRHTEPRVEYRPAEAGGRGSLSLSLRSKRGGFFGFGGESNLAEIGLPAGGLAALHVEAGEGQTVIDMSRVACERFRFSTGSGDAHVVFPEQGELAEEVLIAGFGDVTVDRLGGVSPREATVRGGVGSLEVDLRGKWRRDGHVAILGSVGNIRILLPSGVAIAATVGPAWQKAAVAGGLRSDGDRFVGPPVAADRPRLDLTLEPGLGSLDLEWETKP